MVYTFLEISLKPCGGCLTCVLQEHDTPKEHDSVTKLHQDMSDAVNVLMHCWYALEDKPSVRYGTQLADPANG